MQNETLSPEDQIRILKDSFQDEDEHDPLQLTVSRVLHQTTRLCYDFLGLTLFGSFVTFLFGCALWLVFPPRLFSSSLPLRIVQVGLFYIAITSLMSGPALLARRMVEREDPNPLYLFQGYSRYGVSSLGTGLISGIVGTVLAGDAAFFLAQPASGLKLIAIPFLYLFLWWLLAQPYLHPLLLEGFSPLRAFRQAHLLVLANPGFTGGVSFAIIALASLSAVTWLPLMLITPVWASCAGLLALRALQSKYQALEDANRGSVIGDR